MTKVFLVSMSLWSLLHHRFQAYWRVSFRGRRLTSVIVGAFLALYFGGSLVLAGLFFDNVVQEVAPTADPLLVAAKGLLPFGLIYAAVQVVMGSGLGVDPRPYQALPVRRSALVGLLAVFALFSLWNVVPLAFVGAVGVEMALNGAGGAALRFGLASLGVLAAVTYAAPMLRRAASDRPVLAAGTVGVLVAAAAVEAVDLGGSLVSLVDVSGWLFGGVVQAQVLPTSIALVGLIGLVWGYAQWLRSAMVVDRSRRRASSRTSSAWLDRLARRGPAWREAVLELRLVVRNARPRLSLFVSLLFPCLLIGLAFFVDGFAELQDLLQGTQLLNTTIWQGLFGTGAFILFHGTDYFSWRGVQIEAVTVRPVPLQRQIQGKCLLLAASVVVCFLIPLPFLLARGSAFLLVHTSFFLYNLGILVPTATAGALFNRKALAPNQHSFMGETNLSGGRALVAIPTLALPIGVLYGVDPIIGLVLIGGVGLAATLSFPLWLRGLAALYEYNRYAMLRGFRSS